MAKRTKHWNPIRAPLHDHRKTIERIPWGLFRKGDLLTNDVNLHKPYVEFPNFTLPRPSKRYSHVAARTSSWRAPNEGLIEGYDDDEEKDVSALPDEVTMVSSQ